MNKQMNRENLSRMADYIETVPQKKFDMGKFRTGEGKGHECDSVGCVLGHCTVLDENPLPTGRFGDIHLSAWSSDFTGLDSFSDEWRYLFLGIWTAADNTPTGTAKRIRHLLENGLPKNSYEQMKGRAPLPYLKNKTA